MAKRDRATIKTTEKIVEGSYKRKSILNYKIEKLVDKRAPLYVKENADWYIPYAQGFADGMARVMYNLENEVTKLQDTLYLLEKQSWKKNTPRPGVTEVDSQNEFYTDYDSEEDDDEQDEPGDDDEEEEEEENAKEREKRIRAEAKSKGSLVRSNKERRVDVPLGELSLQYEEPIRKWDGMREHYHYPEGYIQKRTEIRKKQRELIAKIKETCGKPPSRLLLTLDTITNEEDGKEYHTIVCMYNRSSKREQEYVKLCQEKFPIHWGAKEAA